MNLDNALKIPGWMEPDCLEWLAEQASTHERIVEVGCWLGRSTRVLADNTPGVVYAIDHWNGSEEHKGDFIGKDPDWVAKEFHTNLRDHIESGKVKPFRMDSVSFATEWLARGRAPFDLTFIDASHDFESVKADILAWKPITRGLLCGHDHGHHPVERAVAEVLGVPESTIGIWRMRV